MQKDSEMERALEAGWEYRQVFAEEFGEFEDGSDFIGDSLSDDRFSAKVVDAVVAEIAESEGWQ
jgi:hypothetical protein